MEHLAWEGRPQVDLVEPPPPHMCMLPPFAQAWRRNAVKAKL